MTCKAFILAFFAVTIPGVADVARGAEAVYHHVHLAAPNPEAAAQWYIEQMGCEVMRDRKDRCQFGTMYLAFRPEAPTGGSDGSAVNHIGFSFTDLAARMKEFEAAGVKIVAPIRDAPGLFRLAFVEDPWGTRIEVVEDPDLLGFHHVHLRSADPAAALQWYHTVLGGQMAMLKGRLDGLLLGKAWLLATRQTPAPQGFLGHLIAREFSQEECRDGEARSGIGGGGSPSGDRSGRRARSWGSVFGRAQARDGAASAARGGS